MAVREVTAKSTEDFALKKSSAPWNCYDPPNIRDLKPFFREHTIKKGEETKRVSAADQVNAIRFMHDEAPENFVACISGEDTDTNAKLVAGRLNINWAIKHNLKTHWIPFRSMSFGKIDTYFETLRTYDVIFLHSVFHDSTPGRIELVRDILQAKAHQSQAFVLVTGGGEPSLMRERLRVHFDYSFCVGA